MGILTSHIQASPRGLALHRFSRTRDRVAGGLLNLHDDERRRMARTLHDTTAQNLAALSINLSLVAQEKDPRRVQAILLECSLLTEACLGEVRALSLDLHPPLLDELGIQSALLSFIDGYQRRTGIAVTLECDAGLGRFTSEVELVAFRIAQESLLNVERHSGSAKAEVRFTRRGFGFEMVVRDWGTGLHARAHSSNGLGLGGMRERARLVGGAVEIVSVTPGTRVRANFQGSPRDCAIAS